MLDFPSKYKAKPESSIGLLFIKAYNRWHTLIKECLKEFDLTHSQFVALTTLGYLSTLFDEVSQVMVSKYCDIDVMTLSQILNLLEKKGLIFRKTHSKDSRAKCIVLTQEGADKIRLALPKVESVDEEFFNDLKEKQNDFKECLQRLSVEFKNN